MKSSVEIDPNPYVKKLERLWTRAFFFYGLQIRSRPASFDGLFRKLLVSVYCFINAAIVVHYSAAVGYNSAYGKNIGAASFLIPLGINGALAGLGTFIFYRRRKLFHALLVKLNEIVVDREEKTKTAWKHAIAQISFTETALVIACSAVSAQFLRSEGPQAQFFVKLYFMGVEIAPEHTTNAIYAIVFEILVLMLVPMTFVNVSIAFYAYVCYVLAVGFENFNLELEHHLRVGRLNHNVNLNYFRNKHQLMCKLTDEVSRLFSPLLVVGVLGLIVTVCFDLRALKGIPSVLFLTCFVAGGMRHACLLFFLFKDAARINKQAHKISEKIVTLPITGAFNENDTHNHAYNANYMLFTNRLIDTNIGVTASGLFVMSTGSFLSMTGTVLTYVIVLYQTA